MKYKVTFKKSFVVNALREVEAEIIRRAEEAVKVVQAIAMEERERADANELEATTVAEVIEEEKLDKTSKKRSIKKK